MLSAEEILCNTQQVIAGLEALKGENRGLLESLREASQSGGVEQEKSGLIRQSLERIELGLNEAQVPGPERGNLNVSAVFKSWLFKVKLRLERLLLCR